jgi:hypothetical protein
VKRPARIRIVGKAHEVAYVPGGHPELKEGEDVLTGCINHDRQTVFVEDGQPLEAEQDTLLHEVFHGVERAMDLDLEETAIRRMATGFLAVIKDNPSFLRYLAQKQK